MSDPITSLAGSLVDFARVYTGQDGTTLTILTFGNESARGYTAVVSTTTGFVLHQGKPDVRGPLLEIEESATITESVLRSANAFALGGKVLKYIGSGKIDPVGSPRVWQIPVSYDGETYP